MGQYVMAELIACDLGKLIRNSVLAFAGDELRMLLGVHGGCRKATAGLHKEGVAGLVVGGRTSAERHDVVVGGSVVDKISGY